MDKNPDSPLMEQVRTPKSAALSTPEKVLMVLTSAQLILGLADAIVNFDGLLGQSSRQRKLSEVLQRFLAIPLPVSRRSIGDSMVP